MHTWTVDELILIRRYRLQGLSFSHIAAVMGCTRSQIAGVCSRHITGKTEEQIAYISDFPIKSYIARSVQVWSGAGSREVPISLPALKFMEGAKD